MVVAIDLSPAQIACLRIRIAAYRTLDHAGLLELMGIAPVDAARRAARPRVPDARPDATRPSGRARRDDVIRHGLGGVGKFERYFRIFRRWLLPLVHSRATIDEVFVSKADAPSAQRFLDERWNNWRWRCC